MDEKIGLDPSIAEEVSREDFPALFRVADDSSLEAQRKYILLIRVSLIAMVGGTLLVELDFVIPGWTRAFVVLGAALMATAFFATLLVSQKSYKDRWYSGRAVAESVKTLSWRFMMAAEPFHDRADREMVEQHFLSKLKDMLRQDALAGTVQA